MEDRDILRGPQHNIHAVGWEGVAQRAIIESWQRRMSCHDGKKCLRRGNKCQKYEIREYPTSWEGMWKASKVIVNIAN